MGHDYRFLYLYSCHSTVGKTASPSIQNKFGYCRGQYARSVIDVLPRSITPADSMPTQCVVAYTSLAEYLGIACEVAEVLHRSQAPVCWLRLIPAQ